MLDKPTATATAPATLDDVMTELKIIRDLIEEQRAGATQLHEPPEDGLSTFQACLLTGRSRQCLVNWCERYGIGRFGGEPGRVE